METRITRRTSLACAGAATIGALTGTIQAAEPNPRTPPRDESRLRQAVCEWCFKVPIEELAAQCAKLGLVGIDLLKPADFHALKPHGLICTMTRSHGINDGLNRKENWGACLQSIREAIDANANAGFPNVITFSGNRAGMSDDEGLANCAEALKQIVGHAEQRKVTICMELLNSKRNHKDYMCDRTAWGVQLVKCVGSERFKLLYDIFHMQIMEGDVIDTIRENKDYIGHYHTAGVPGRHELDETQELYYPPIVKAIIETGYRGVLAHEFKPLRDPMTSLAEAVKQCDV